MSLGRINMANPNELKAVQRLLECPDLNLEELEDETIQAMEEIKQVFGLKQGGN
jgi:hypothetical protein